MTANSPASYTLSVMLHAAFVAAILFTAYAFKNENAQETTKIFELVAGAGDNWAATEAPALGTPDGVSFQPAPRPVAPPQPEPVSAPQPEPSPVTPSPPVQSPVAPAPVEAVTPPKTEPKTEPKKTPPPKTLAQQVDAIAARKEKQVVTKFRKEEAAREKREAAERAKAEAAAAAKRTTFDQFSKDNPKKIASNTKAGGSTSYEKVSTKGITGGVDGGTTDKPGAGGKVLSRAEQDELASYFTFLKQKLLEAHEPPSGVSDQLSATVSFHISANGTLSQAKIIRSSGNADYDRSVLATFASVGSIGKRPDDRSDTREVTFRRKDSD